MKSPERNSPVLISLPGDDLQRLADRIFRSRQGISKTQPLSRSHPLVRVPKKLSEHSKNDIVTRCAKRMAPHSIAIDTLLRSLQQLQHDPHNPKYRTINTATAVFQRRLCVPGVLDFFAAMNYHPTPRNQRMIHMEFLDIDTLNFGVSALEHIQLTSSKYKTDKEKRVFNHDIQHFLKNDNDDERTRRKNLLQDLPKESTSNSGFISVTLGNETKISRKFDGDDTLDDVLRFIGGHGTEILSKLETEEWSLVDLNQTNALPLNLNEFRHKTLQYIGCWPSGRLSVIPTNQAFLPSNNDRLTSQPRGLGSALTESSY